ncbi:MAG: flavodoxin domain-containing protein, partial [Clostridia bacterium]|nr:flavodoxin domain-containing protein [Clostridia bacterium]
MIYYFSATGNSLHAARTIAAALGEGQPVSMTKAGIGAVAEGDVIGFVFPVFAWGLPNMVEDFVSSLRVVNKDAYIFAVVTCGSSVGCCHNRIDVLLRAKGAALSYGSKLRMVANYIPMYDVKTETAEAILQKADVRLAGIIEEIKTRQPNKFTKGMPWVRAFHKMSHSYKESDRDYNV